METSEQAAESTDIFQTIKNFFTEQVLSRGWLILEAILGLVIGVLVVKILLKITARLLSKSRIEKITQSFLLSVVKVLLYVLLIMIVMQILNIPITGIVALLTAGSLALGLAVQDSLANLANGIIIISSKPFHEGDFVNIGGTEGTVKAIKILTTSIATVDNKLVIIPNSHIVTKEVINYNTLGRRRVDFSFSVSYKSDVKLVRDIISSVMKSNGKVYLDPAPFVQLKTLDDSNITFFANCWVDSEDYWDVYYYVMDRAFDEFKKNDISVDYNQLEVRLKDDEVKLPVYKDSLPARVEKVREDSASHDLIDEASKLLKKTKKKRAENKKKKQEQKVANPKTETTKSEPEVKAETTAKTEEKSAPKGKSSKKANK